MPGPRVKSVMSTVKSRVLSTKLYYLRNILLLILEIDRLRENIFLVRIIKLTIKIL